MTAVLDRALEWPATTEDWGVRPDGRPNAVPRFITPRDYSRRTRGPKEGLVAAKLGAPYMPWQQHVADLTHEIDERGRLAYGSFVMLVPRQSGKTRMVLGKTVHRAFGFGRRQNVVYTAQSRGKAREKWAEEHVPEVERSIFRRLIKNVRYANDSESLVWANGSRWGIEAPTETAGHGPTNDLAFIDEAFSQVDARVEQALSPTMVTRPSSQFVVLSTAGNSRSLYLRDKVDRGRALVLAGRRSRMCYCEYSAPDDADPFDEDLWWWYMPALGYTQDLDAVRTQLDTLGPDEFRRAFMCQWPRSDVVEQVIPLADWRTAADPKSRIVGARAFSVDVTPDRSYSAVAVCGRRGDGLEHIEVVRHDRDTDWVPEMCRRLTGNWQTAGPVVLCGAAAGALRDDIRDLGVDVMVMSLGDQRDAAAMLYDRVPSRVRHLDQPSMNTALAGATKSESSGAWTWNRKGATDISPLCAESGALWGWVTAGEQVLDSFYADEEDDGGDEDQAGAA